MFILAQAEATFWQEFVPLTQEVLTDGGWVMIPLFLLAVYIYYEASALILQMSKAKLKQTPKETWTQWVFNPQQGQGHIGDVIRFISTGGFTQGEMISRLQAIRSRFLPDINQKITVLSTLVTVAPLMGLLGTVIGMLTTFKGLAQSSGQTVDLVAEGIRVALITTQTGLMIAIPGYIFISTVVKKRNQYLEFLAELESYVVQETYKKESA